MSLVHTQGVVLRYTNIKDSDRMLSIFSPKYGKLSVLARGCRKPRSKFLSMSQPFSYGKVVLKPYRDIYILNQSETINAYFDLRKDIERLSLASYILKLTEDVVNPGEGNPELFTLLLKTLSFLSFSESNPLDIILIYELKLLDILGYRPSIEKCIICDQDRQESTYFSIRGGTVCSKCSSKSTGFDIDMTTLQAMGLILKMDISRIANLKLNSRVRVELNEIMPAYINDKLDKQYPSRDYINTLFKQQA
ncbi:MAG TPA: DNA repair protein RecO [Bacillota bacterium]|nr:DNA repair protein RecO [Bacillota bacterium]